MYTLISARIVFTIVFVSILCNGRDVERVVGRDSWIIGGDHWRTKCNELMTEEEHMEITSLHNLAGMINRRTIRLTGAVQDQQLSIIIDNGTPIYNFIQDSVAYKLGLELHPLPKFQVFFGSREYLICCGMCQ